MSFVSGRLLIPPNTVEKGARNSADREFTLAWGLEISQGFLNSHSGPYMWDQSQTIGNDVPEFSHSVSGEAGAHRDRLIDFLARQNITLEYNEMIAPALGVSYGGRIALLPGQPPAEEFPSLIHVSAHELMHRTERRT